MQKLVREGRLTEGQARPLIGLENEKQIELADVIQRKNLNARQAEELAAAARGNGKKTSERRARSLNPDLLLVENLCRDTLGCKVKAQVTSTKGTITLSYFTKDDLGRIYDALTSLQQS